MNPTFGTRRRWRLARAARVGPALLVLGGLGVARTAAAQAMPIISTDNTAVLRFAPDSDASIPQRPPNENPRGISYSDCAADDDMQFTLDLTQGFPEDSEIQVWVGEGDCITQAASRSPGSSQFGRCWQAAPTSAFPAKAGASTTTGRLHMRDIVAYIGNSDPPAAYTPTGVSACQPMSADSVIDLTIAFMLFPKSAGGGTADGGSTVAYLGTPGTYSLTAALIGPFEPLGVGVQEGGIGDGVLTISWQPQVEATIQGYNIYYEDLTVAAVGATMPSQLEAPVLCKQKLVCAPTDSGQADANPVDAACEAGLSDAFSPVDGAAYANLSDAALAAMGCERLATASGFDGTSTGTGGSSCTATALINVFTVDGGLGTSAITATPEPSTTFVDAGAGDTGFDTGLVIDSGTTTVVTTPTAVQNPETAGISNISSRYRYAFVAGATTSSFQLTGLTDGHQYAITVAAVDGSGNVGPVGSLACAAPEPVTDFYSAYTAAGGQAGGGYCTVVGAGAPAFGSLFGIGLAGTIVALTRRRRRRAR